MPLPFISLTQSVSTVAVWARDTGDTLQLGATGLSNDAETLQLLEDALRGALAALRIAATAGNAHGPSEANILAAPAAKLVAVLASWISARTLPLPSS